MPFTAINRNRMLVAAVTFFAAAVIGWPVLAEGRSFTLSVLALIVMWAWFASLVGVGSVPQPYQWAAAAFAVALSFVSPFLSFWASGVLFETFAGPWLAIALFFTALCVLILRRSNGA